MTTSRRAAGLALPIASLLLGLMWTYHPTLFPFLQKIQTDEGDSRHLNYILEHNYRWLAGDPLHREVFSPPVFYPEEGTGAYTETLLGVMPFYVPWRLAGLPPDTSLQAFVLLAGSLNFMAALVLFRRAFGFGLVPSCAGAFLFAFAGVRTVRSGHQQLTAHFFTLVAVFALTRLFASAPGRGPRRWLWLFFAAFVAQLYACYYYAWFLTLALAVAAAFAFLHPAPRLRLTGLVRAAWPQLLAGILVSALLTWPLARAHLEAARILGPRKYSDMSALIPGVPAWLNVGPASWVFAKTSQWPLFRDQPFEWEKRLGLGPVTSLTVAAGLWVARRRWLARMLTLSAMTLAVLVTTFGDGLTPWHLVFDWVPGASALRAVGRVVLLLLVPAAFGLAAAVEALLLRGRRAPAGALLAFVALEQGQTMPSYDKEASRQRVAAIAGQIPADCEAFYYVATDGRRPFWVNQIDGMWAAMNTGRATVNGYSSNLPIGWRGLVENDVLAPGMDRLLRKNLRLWLRRQHRLPDSVCWAEWPPRASPAPPALSDDP